MESTETKTNRPQAEGEKLYCLTFGTIRDGKEISSAPLTGAGSGRLYLRVEAPGHPSAVFTWGQDDLENRTFVNLARSFRKNGVRVPRIFGVMADGHGYLQEDLGRSDLLSHLSGPRRIELSEKALRGLAEMQFIPRAEWEPFVMVSGFDRRQVLWDLNYYKYDFLKVAGIGFDEGRLEDDFVTLATRLTDGIDPRLSGFMFRDFQSRNVIVDGGEVGFIDFQGGRRGPCLYDAVSFLWQAKARFSPEERKRLLDFYSSEVETLTGVAAREVLAGLDRMVLFRTLQVLGAYGLRGLVEKKSHFIESLPSALSNLKALLESDVFEGLPELEKTARAACASRFAARCEEIGLTVTVFSFSYKLGYPEDLTGNGGGFMFDCRGMHNPGLYERYKPLTGLDEEVIAFLRERGEAGEFVAKALSLVSPSVARYVRRGFSSLQVGFGCTGGRHRSVYCAEMFAGAVAEAFPEARVVVEHREQGLTRCLNAGS